MIATGDLRIVLCGMLQENAYLVCPGNRDDGFLVDPGDDLSALEQAVLESGRRLTHILLTHGHFDHVLAAAPLAERFGAEIYVHIEDEVMLCDAEKGGYNPGLCRLSLPEKIKVRHYPETLECCGCVLRVMHTPGHSRGSVCLYEEASGTLFSGDTLFCAGFGRTDFYGGSRVDMRNSMLTLLAMPQETRVLCGHGPETTIAAERRRYGR